MPLSLGWFREPYKSMGLSTLEGKTAKAFLPMSPPLPMEGALVAEVPQGEPEGALYKSP